MKTKALAQMETASFCGRVCHKRYSVQLETAPEDKIYHLKSEINSTLTFHLNIVHKYY